MVRFAPRHSRLDAAGATLDTGNSGTTLRTLTGAVSGRPFTTTLSGDTSLRLRPMRSTRGSPSGNSVPPWMISTEEPHRSRCAALVGAEVWIPVASARFAPHSPWQRCGPMARSRLDSPPAFRNHGALAHGPRPRQGKGASSSCSRVWCPETRSDHSGDPSSTQRSCGRRQR